CCFGLGIALEPTGGVAVGAVIGASDVERSIVPRLRVFSKLGACQRAPLSARLQETYQVVEAAVPAMLVAAAAPFVRESLVAEDDLRLLPMIVELDGHERVRHRAFLPLPCVHELRRPLDDA